MKYIFQPGNHPSLSIAEIRCIFKPDTLEVLSNNFIQINTDLTPDQVSKKFRIMGSCLRVMTLCGSVPHPQTFSASTPKFKLITQLIASLSQAISDFSEKTTKVTYGISDFNTSPLLNFTEIQQLAIKLKVRLKKEGFKVRAVISDKPTLSIAQLIYNNMCANSGGVELGLILSANHLLITTTIAYQNINDYAARDQERPCRDAYVGMLPPKLAQILVNLSSRDHTTTILDPFCGTGVSLQEAILGGYSVVGTDNSSKMIKYTETNLEWLKSKRHNINPALTISLQVADATTHKWDCLTNNQGDVAIASELYLGKPQNRLKDKHELDSVVQEVNQILKKFLTNLAAQTSPGFRLCLAIPKWRTLSEDLSLSTLASLDALGYNEIKFESADSELVYSRSDQVTMRRIIVLQRVVSNIK